MKIGSAMTDQTNTATLGCFVYRPGTKKLYAVVSRHAFSIKGQPVFTKKSIPFSVGSVEEISPDTLLENDRINLDATLVGLKDNIVRSLKEKSFIVRRDNKDITLTSVFNPEAIRVAKSKGELPPQIKALHYIVWHCGQKSLEREKSFHRFGAIVPEMTADSFAYNNQFGIISAADIAVNRFVFAERHNRPGDSGGAIYQDDGTLIGFNGGGIGARPSKEYDQKATAGGFYRLAHDVFNHFGVKLATWDNRLEWMPVDVVLSESSGEEDEDPFGGADPFASGNFKVNSSYQAKK